MAWWIFADGRPAAAFRVYSMMVVVGALIGIVTANTWVDPAGEWANEARYAVVVASALVAWVIANYQYHRMMSTTPT